MVNDKEEQVVRAAFDVFIRYGYKRVTMADLAEAAQMSRPALYLVFPSKEKIFIEVVRQMTAENLEKIRSAISPLQTVDEKLAHAFEIWCVGPYELMRTSPDAADLYVSVKEFAAEVIKKSALDFEALLVEILEPAVGKKSKSTLSAPELARLMRTSLKGFNMSADNATELRQLLADMRKLVLAGL
jgi:AcrR family transcriptional regulator